MGRLSRILNNHKRAKSKFPHFQPFDSPYHWFTPIFFNILDFFDFLGMMVVVYTTSLDNLIFFSLSSLFGEYVSRRKVEWQPCFRYMVESRVPLLFFETLYTCSCTNAIARIALWRKSPHLPNCTSCSLDNRTSPTQFGPFLCWKFVKSTVHKVVVSSVNYCGSFLALCQKVSSLNMTISPPPPICGGPRAYLEIEKPIQIISSTYIPSIMGWMKWSPTNGIIHFSLKPKLCSHLKLTLHLKVYHKNSLQEEAHANSIHPCTLIQWDVATTTIGIHCS